MSEPNPRRDWIDSRAKTLVLASDKPITYFEAMKQAAKEYNDKFVDNQASLF